MNWTLVVDAVDVIACLFLIAGAIGVLVCNHVNRSRK